MPGGCREIRGGRGGGILCRAAVSAGIRMERVERNACAVGERSVSLRRRIVRSAGDIGSANADMSSDKQGEKPCRRKPKVSCATFIGAG
jgi:hypothetical protein